MLDSLRQVDSQHVDRRATDGHEAPHNRAVPREVIGPIVLARMEESRQLARVGVVAGYIKRLERVAARALSRKRRARIEEWPGGARISISPHDGD